MYLSEIARGVFKNQLQVMHLHLDGCVEGKDPIHLHDLRVASRKTRAALIEFKDLLPDEVYQKYRDDFRWIHNVTGNVRDLDVGLSHFPELKKEIKKPWRSHLKPLRVLLEKKRKNAQDEMKEILGGQRVAEILISWSNLLDENITNTSTLSQESAREYGCQRIIKRYSELQKSGLKLAKNTPAEEYHEYRIQIKKMRYLLDFFQPAMDQKDFIGHHSMLKSAQDAFGVFQDTGIQAQNLRNLAGELADEGVEVDTLLALGQILGVLEKRLLKQKSMCLKQTRRLISDTSARAFQGCF